MDFKRNDKSRSEIFSRYHGQTETFSLLSLISFSINQDDVSGRMGLLVLLYLIQINLYKEVEAPSKRGFSSIEIWFVGIQMPILVAMLEYGMILALKKVCQKKEQKIFSVVDLCTFCLSVFHIIVFNGIFWLT